RQDDKDVRDACLPLNDPDTALCTRLERDFLRTLMGGCTTPISALATIQDGQIVFEGNVLSPDGKKKKEIKKTALVTEAADLGKTSGAEMLLAGAKEILEGIHAAS